MVPGFGCPRLLEDVDDWVTGRRTTAAASARSPHSTCMISTGTVADRRELRADRGDAGQRLDRVLLRRLADRADASRTRIQRWIKAGLVSVNGVPALKPGGRVAAAASIALSLPAPPGRPEHLPEHLSLEVLFEDPHLLVLSKPAGVIVHPSRGHAAGTLMNALLWRAKDWESRERPGLVHRLDKHTSGVMVVAKSRAVHGRLARAMIERRIEKDYLAIVLGRVPRVTGEIHLALARDPVDRRRVVVDDRGRESLTLYERLDVSRRAGLTLLRCRLLTGRMHQIRVHLAAAGWPIVGDPVYGRRGAPSLPDPIVDAAVRTFPRQALHAWRLAFVHPVTGGRLDIRAPIAGDMAGLLSAAGLRAPTECPGPAQAF